MGQPLDFRPAAAYAAAYGPFPDDYLAVDLETTGLDRTLDWPLQIGWCVVRGGRAASNAAVLVDWPSHVEEYRRAAFVDRLLATGKSMAHKGLSYPWTLEQLRAKGVSPQEAFRRLYAQNPSKNWLAHFGWGFDFPCLGRAAQEAGAEPFEPEHEKLWDTAMLVKACQTGLTPRPGEPLRQFLLRLHDARAKGKFSLKECFSIFSLAELGATPRAEYLHESAYDAWLTVLVFEKIKEGVRKLAGPA